MAKLLSPDPPPPQAAHHRVAVRGHAGALNLDISAELSAPWTVVFGPSGSGKSTLLRAMAGLAPSLDVTFERSADGYPATLAAGHHGLAPERRALAYAPQQAALFPHMTVAENVRFPATVRAGSSSSFAADALSLLDLQRFADRRIGDLSGGERQRVSLARALAVPHARLLLLDEPFAGVDRALRDDLLPRLRAHLASRNLPVVSVTHDVDEALLLDSEVIRLYDGRVASQGPAHQVLADEITRMQRLLQG